MKGQNLTIRDLPRMERPREKLLKYGASSLSAAELLAILLGAGRKGVTINTLDNTSYNLYTLNGTR